MDRTRVAAILSRPRRKAVQKESPSDPKKLMKEVLDAAWSKNAYATRVLDVSKLVTYAELFVILTGRSDRHVQAIADAIEGAMKEKGVSILGVEGRQAGTWILMDFGSVIVHVFEKTTRDYYELEKLWSDAEVVEVTEPEWVREFATMEAGYNGP